MLHLKIISSNCKVHILPFRDIKISTDGQKGIKEMLRSQRINRLRRKGSIPVFQMIPSLPCLHPWHFEKIYIPSIWLHWIACKSQLQQITNKAVDQVPLWCTEPESRSDKWASLYRSLIWPREREAGSDWQDQSPPWKREMESKPIFTEKCLIIILETQT